MEDKNCSKENLETLTKAELEKKKLVADLLTAQGCGSNWLENFMKKIFVPIVVPILTLVAGFLYFWFNHLDSEKAKALDRYKTEIEIVKMVWPDIKGVNIDSLNFKKGSPCDKKATEDCATITERNLVTIRYNNAVKFLTNFYVANHEIYGGDISAIGIDTVQRPIYRLKETFPEIKNKVKNEELKQDLSLKSTDTTKIKDDKSQATKDRRTKFKPVVNEDTNKAIVSAINKLENDSKTYTIYIQYSNQSNKDKVEKMAFALKSFYIVTPIEFVKNTSNYTNEVRYYRKEDQPKAVELATRLKQLSGIDFSLKNINYANTKRVFEIWYDNSQPIPETTEHKNITPEKDKEFKTILSEDHYAALGYFNAINDNINVFADDYNPKDDTVKMRINDQAVTLAIGADPQELQVGNYQVIIKANDFKRNGTLRKVIMYSIILRQKL